MDLGAYVQMDALEDILRENNISVPRLRGLRLMSQEKPVSRDKIFESGYRLGLYQCEYLCENGFGRTPWYEFSKNTRKIKRKYLIYCDDDFTPTAVRWDRIHGKKRKLFKFSIKQALKRSRLQYETFNKYCGRPDILYIHARIGGGNWPYYHSEVDHQPWFIEKVDDAFDSTYCDIYARIQEPHKETQE